MQRASHAHAEGLHIPTVWIAIVIQLVGMLFFAGSGWNRLDTVEKGLISIGQRLPLLEAASITLTSRAASLESMGTTMIARMEKYDEVKERLVRLELSLSALTSSLDKIGDRLESIIVPTNTAGRNPRGRLQP